MRQYSRCQTEPHFDFERFNALRVEGSSCQAEIRKLNMASPIHQKILTKCQRLSKIARPMKVPLVSSHGEYNQACAVHLQQQTFR